MSFGNLGKKYYISTMGTTTITLQSEHEYMLVIQRLNSTETSHAGLYLISAHTDSSLVPIKQSGTVTVAVNSTTLTITTTTNYVWCYLIDLSTAMIR